MDPTTTIYYKCTKFSIFKEIQINLHECPTLLNLKKLIASDLLINDSQIDFESHLKEPLNIKNIMIIPITINKEEHSDSLKTFFYVCKSPEMKKQIKVDTNIYKSVYDLIKLIQSEYDQYTLDIKIETRIELPLRYIKDGMEFNIIITFFKNYLTERTILYKIKNLNIEDSIKIDTKKYTKGSDLFIIFASELQIHKNQIQIEKVPELPLRFLKEDCIFKITIKHNEKSYQQKKKFIYTCKDFDIVNSFVIDTRKIKNLKDLQEQIESDLHIELYCIDIKILNPPKLPLEYIKEGIEFYIKIIDKNRYSYYNYNYNKSISYKIKDLNIEDSIKIDTKKCTKGTDLIHIFASELQIHKNQIQIEKIPELPLRFLKEDCIFEISIRNLENSDQRIKNFYYICESFNIKNKFEIDTNIVKNAKTLQKQIESDFHIELYNIDINILNPPKLPLEYVNEGAEFYIDIIDKNRYSYYNYNYNKSISYKIKGFDHINSFKFSTNTNCQIEELIANDLQIRKEQIQMETVPILPIKFINENYTFIITILNSISAKIVKTFQYKIKYINFNKQIKVDTKIYQSIDDLRKLIAEEIQMNDHKIKILNATKLPLRFIEDGSIFNIEIENENLNINTDFQISIKNSCESNKISINTYSCYQIDYLEREIASFYGITNPRIKVKIENPPVLPLKYVKSNYKFIISILNDLAKISFQLSSGKIIQIPDSHQMSYKEIANFILGNPQEKNIFYSDKCYTLSIEGKELPRIRYPLINVTDNVLIFFELKNIVSIKYNQFQFNFIENESVHSASRFIETVFPNYFQVFIQKDNCMKLKPFDKILKSGDYKIKVEIKVYFYHYSDNSFPIQILHLDYFSTVLDAKQQLEIFLSDLFYTHDIVIYGKNKQKITDTNIKLIEIQQLNNCFYFNICPKESQIIEKKVDSSVTSLSEQETLPKEEKNTHKKRKIKPKISLIPVENSPLSTPKNKKEAEFSNQNEDISPISMDPKTQPIKNIEQEADAKSISLTFEFEENCGSISSFTKKIPISTTINDLSSEIASKYLPSEKIDIKYKEGENKIKIDKDMCIDDIQEEIEAGGNILFIGICQIKPKNKKNQTKINIKKYKPKVTDVDSNDEMKSKPKDNPKRSSQNNDQNRSDYQFNYQGQMKILRLHDDSSLHSNEIEIMKEFQIDEVENIEFAIADEIIDSNRQMKEFRDHIIIICTQNNRKTSDIKYFYQTNLDDEVSNVELSPEATVFTMKKHIMKKYKVSDASNIKILFSGKEMLNKIKLVSLHLGDFKLFVYIRSEEDILLMTAKALLIDNEYEYEYEEEEEEKEKQ